MISISYFRNKCIGCNACVEADPNRWRVSKKDGKCNLIGSKEKKGIYLIHVGNEEIDSIKAASKNCPAKIIKFTIK
ncbi:MAG: ferredoxin [Ignavibacteriae bacterium]|nr:ferredoxin [Ignavibacteriota bacterium]